MHESTASRVTSNKYIATERGIFELKFFFTNAVGRAGTAAAAVRHRIRVMIDAEAPGAILSDDMIVVQLQEDGIDIARRTVAKYRHVLGLPSSAGPRRRQAMMPQGGSFLGPPLFCGPETLLHCQGAGPPLVSAPPR